MESHIVVVNGKCFDRSALYRLTREDCVKQFGNTALWPEIINTVALQPDFSVGEQAKTHLYLLALKIISSLYDYSPPHSKQT